jgi:hypothetical protein
MLSEDTADCLALANIAILMRLIEELIERGAVARPTLLLQDAVTGDRRKSADVALSASPATLADSGNVAPEPTEIVRHFALATTWSKPALLLPRYQRKL